MGRPEASSPGPWFYPRSRAWEDCTDTQSQTRHGEPLNMAGTKRSGFGECSPRLCLALSPEGGVLSLLHSDLKQEG